VRGYALLRTEPGEALLWLTLTALEDEPGPALSDVATRTAALVALLDGIGVAKADRSTTGIAVDEEYDHTKSGRHLVGHRATSQTSVRLTDPELIGQLVARAADG
jgi:uncharacterized protein YggE